MNSASRDFTHDTTQTQPPPRRTHPRVLGVHFAMFILPSAPDRTPTAAATQTLPPQDQRLHGIVRPGNILRG